MKEELKGEYNNLLFEKEKIQRRIKNSNSKSVKYLGEKMIDDIDRKITFVLLSE